MTSFTVLPDGVLSEVSGGLTPMAQALEEAYKKGFANPPPGASPHLGGLFNVYRKGGFDIVDAAHNESLVNLRKTHIMK
jgi:hypothetical protein